MSNAALDYWEEAVAQSMEEHGVQATAEQIKRIAADIEGCHDNYSLAFPIPDGPSLVQRELDDTKAALAAERNKVHCRHCDGTGRIVLHGPYHSSDSQCWKCRGEGRHA